ncbi:MAG TPA: HD domain-containing protein [Candidatus Tumulicola sp.]|jgi:tRNA nucleotidyltransferase (CCA-adding enzyme)
MPVSRETPKPNALEIDERLAAGLPDGALFAVGGRVRDEIRRIEEQTTEADDADLDYLVTGITTERLLDYLSKIGRVDVVGASFAVVKLTIDRRTVDITLPRRERSTGSGHRDFEVQSRPDVSLEDDLARRDFRMNMIARGIPSNAMVDPYGGVADIAERRIDILRPQAFEEDPLRMLRAAQFAARFEYHLTPATLDAMSRAAHLTPTVSPERIADELTKLLVKAKRPSIGFELLRETGVLAEFWPELVEGYGVDQNEWHAYDVWYHAMATVDASPPGDLTLRLAALLHDVGKPRTKDGPHFYRHESVGSEMAVSMLSRLRFSNDVIADVSQLIAQHMFAADPELSDAAVRRFIRRVGVDRIERLFAVRQADVAGSGLPKRGDHNERFAERVWGEVARKPAFSVADLHVRGDDVVAAMIRRGFAEAGYRGDARVGETLQWLFEQVTDAPERNERTSLLLLLERYFDQHPGRAALAK